MKASGALSAAALMFALLAPAAHAQTPPAELTPVEPALFVARDADSAIYLFGTVHIRLPGSDWGGANAQSGCPHLKTCG